MSAIVVASPVGALRVTARGGAVTHLAWDAAAAPGGAADGVLAEAAAQLDAWFAGRLTRFSLPLAPSGTVFQRRVWDAISAIPYGETRAYGEIAAAVGGVARAVGGACGANPIPIFIPCHRVTAAGGKPGGWSGGAGAKDALLALEARRGGGRTLFRNRDSNPGSDAKP